VEALMFGGAAVATEHRVGVGSHNEPLVDLLSVYSKRPDLLVDLDHMLRQLEQAADDSDPQSVQSTGRVGRVHGLQDRY